MHAKVKFFLNSRVIDLLRAFIFEIQSWRARLAARGKKRGQNLNSRYTELFFTGTKERERERERKTERRRNHVITPTSSSMHRVNKHFFLLCEKEGNKSKKEGEKKFFPSKGTRERGPRSETEKERNEKKKEKVSMAERSLRIG